GREVRSPFSSSAVTARRPPSSGLFPYTTLFRSIMLAINIMLLVAGCFLPPAAIILMTTPILMPVIEAVGFDPIWFGVILTINMELGLITPPVGLNLFVINAITPDVRLPVILRGALPFMGCMVLAIIIISIFPGIATWLPAKMMGP